MKNQNTNTMDKIIDNYTESIHDWSPIFNSASEKSFNKMGWIMEEMEEAFDQWLRYNEEVAEYVGMYPEGKGWKSMGKLSKHKQLELFLAFASGYVGVVIK